MILLTGFSGSGKSHIEELLRKLGLNKLTSYTSRPIREGETNHTNYHYITEDEFEDKVQEGFFAENVFYQGNYYGCAKEDCLDNSIVVVEPKGLQQLNTVPGLNITSICIKTNMFIRVYRMIRRKDKIKNILKRLISDPKVFKDIENKVDYIITNNKNDQGSHALAKIKKILKNINITI